MCKKFKCKTVFVCVCYRYRLGWELGRSWVDSTAAPGQGPRSRIWICDDRSGGRESSPRCGFACREPEDQDRRLAMSRGERRGRRGKLDLNSESLRSQEANPGADGEEMKVNVGPDRVGVATSAKLQAGKSPEVPSGSVRLVGMAGTRNRRSGQRSLSSGRPFSCNGRAASSLHWQWKKSFQFPPPTSHLRTANYQLPAHRPGCHWQRHWQ